MWLHRTRATLNQYSVQAEAKLQFTPMHKLMKLQLPDLQHVYLKLDFSVKVFNAVVQLAREMGKCTKEHNFCLKTRLTPGCSQICPVTLEYTTQCLGFNVCPMTWIRIWRTTPYQWICPVTVRSALLSTEEEPYDI